MEAVLGAFPALPSDLLVARIHAWLWASLASLGSDAGARDRLVAATAISVGWRVGSSNARHFSRAPGLNVTLISLTKACLEACGATPSCGRGGGHQGVRSRGNIGKCRTLSVQSSIPYTRAVAATQ